MKFQRHAAFNVFDILYAQVRNFATISEELSVAALLHLIFLSLCSGCRKTQQNTLHL